MREPTVSVTFIPEQEYENLVRQYRAAFQRLARRLTRDHEDAEDLLQETLLDAYRAFGSFRADSHFYSWVARIMTNNHLDRLRRKRLPVVSLDHAGGPSGDETLELPDENANPERLVLREQLDAPFHTALAALQPVQRATVLLCDLDGASYEEAARVEACPIGTIRSRLNRAHHALRGFLATLEFRLEPLPAAPGPMHSRRAFLRLGTAAAAGAALTQLGGVDEALAEPETARVLLWCGVSPVPPAALALAEGLRAGKYLEVTVASPSSAGAAPDDTALRAADVLVWWDPERSAAIPPARLAAIARRVRDGGMGLIATHPGDAPFRALMGCAGEWSGGLDEEGAELEVRVTAPRHPIARGLEGFRIARSVRCEGTLDVPQPELLVFDGRYAPEGPRAWQGMVWKAGSGRVFLFQPGHREQPVYQQDEVRRIFQNAAQWCATRG